MTAYELGMQLGLGKSAVALTLGGSDRLEGGKKKPGITQAATKRVRVSMEDVDKPRSAPDAPHAPAAGTSGWGPR